MRPSISQSTKTQEQISQYPQDPPEGKKFFLSGIG
jgi:hypothetical protein